MTDDSPKRFDCVQTMRQIRDGISKEIADMSYDELTRWLRGQEYSDPFLKALAAKAARSADAMKRSA